jgi:hypothetical protein
VVTGAVRCDTRLQSHECDTRACTYAHDDTAASLPRLQRIVQYLSSQDRSQRSGTPPLPPRHQRRPQRTPGNDASAGPQLQQLRQGRQVGGSHKSGGEPSGCGRGTRLRANNRGSRRTVGEINCGAEADSREESRPSNWLQSPTSPGLRDTSGPGCERRYTLFVCTGDTIPRQWPTRGRGGLRQRP